MINTRYRLIKKQNIVIDFVDEKVGNDDVIIRPTRLSICHADQRYYQGHRPDEVMKKKLPMCLIHEACGVVIQDNSNTFNVGDNVVMIPNTPSENHEFIKENYLRSSKFRGSGYDGFMQNFIVINKSRVLKYDNINQDIASFIELISVSVHAVNRLISIATTSLENIAVWGDGPLGYMTSLLLTKILPESKIIVCGKNDEQLAYFSFVNETYNIDNLPKDIRINHAFECVGGTGSEFAIDQIIDVIDPQGVIGLLGVNEEKPGINTRMVLEKGLTLIGSSRSGYEDFKKTIDLLEANNDVQEYLSNIATEVIKCKSIDDIHRAFEVDLTNRYKTILEWEI